MSNSWGIFGSCETLKVYGSLDGPGIPDLPPYKRPRKNKSHCKKAGCWLKRGHPCERCGAPRTKEAADHQCETCQERFDAHRKVAEGMRTFLPREQYLDEHQLAKLTPKQKALREELTLIEKAFQEFNDSIPYPPC